MWIAPGGEEVRLWGLGTSEDCDKSLLLLAAGGLIRQHFVEFVWVHYTADWKGSCIVVWLVAVINSGRSVGSVCVLQQRHDILTVSF
jgi:hypothetical protein